jgi:hypothetical protein
VKSEDYGMFGGRYPAVVKEYKPESRECRVEIKGITDGADVLPIAEIEYPIGDKSRKGKWETEIEILVDDTVWVAFIGGDPRYPIITGYRNPEIKNSTKWRRWHHENVEIIADKVVSILAREEEFRLSAKKDIQMQTEKDALLKAKGDIKTNAEGKTQIESKGDITILSTEGSITLKSATGMLKI